MLYGIATIYLLHYIRNLVIRLPYLQVVDFAFIVLGTAHFETNTSTRGWIQNIATGLYVAASSSGYIFLALNFGDEGAPGKDWVFRACVIQGTHMSWHFGTGVLF